LKTPEKDRSILASGSAIERTGPRAQDVKWKPDVTSLVFRVRTLTVLLRHRLVPWRAKAAAGCAVAYIVSRIQLIPSFIPVIGQMDDLAVLFVGMKAIRKWTPPAVLAECEAKARSTTMASPFESLAGIAPVARALYNVFLIEIYLRFALRFRFLL
jgi:uncharacterized membrane protein YkvA (DUF1232 family)